MIAGEIQPLSNGRCAPLSDDDFLALMPRIETHARVIFRGLAAVDREEAIAEAVAAAYVAYRRLRERGIDPVHEFPSMMASYAVLQVKDGRTVGSRRSSKDVLSPRAQRKHGFQVQSLPTSTRRSHEDVHSAVGQLGEGCRRKFPRVPGTGHPASSGLVPRVACPTRRGTSAGDASCQRDTVAAVARAARHC